MDEQKESIVEGFQTVARHDLELIEKDFGSIMRGLTSLNRTISGLNIPNEKKIVYLKSIANAKETLSRMEGDCKSDINNELKKLLSSLTEQI